MLIIEFNATPFINAFESALIELESLNISVASKISDLNTSWQSYVQSSKIDSLKQLFSDISMSYGTLEANIGESGGEALRITDQLDSLQKERDKAEEACDLFEHLMAMNNGDVGKLDDLRNSSRSEHQFQVYHVFTFRLPLFSLNCQQSQQ